MKLSEAMRRELIAAWEQSSTVEEAIVNIQEAVDKFKQENLPIEDREWGSYEYNPYSNPQNCGLTLLASAEAEANYDFDIIALWMDNASGRFFMAQDAGCSCPSPFEDVRSVSSFTEVTSFKDVTDFIGAQSYSNPTAESLAGLLRAAREAFRGY